MDLFVYCLSFSRDCELLKGSSHACFIQPWFPGTWAGAWHTLHMLIGWMDGQASELLPEEFPKGSEEMADLIM